MRYYQIEYAKIVEDETGYVWPQIDLESPAYFRGRPNSFWDLQSKRFSEYVPDLNYLELNKGAVLTDLLSGGVAGADGGIVEGFVVSSKLKRIFESFHLVPCRYYEAIIKVGTILHMDYYFMHIVSDLSGYIDYRQTSFYIDEYGNDMGSVEVESDNDLWIKNSQLSGAKIISSHKPFLRKEVVGSFDLFVETYFTFNTYVSERLRRRLLIEGVTGISIKAANDIEVI